MNLHNISLWIMDVLHIVYNTSIMQEANDLKQLLFSLNKMKSCACIIY